MREKEMMFVLVGVVLVLLFLYVNISDQNKALVQKNNELISQNQKLLNQTTSYNDYLAFTGRTYLNENGNGGMFSPDRNMLYVKTNYGDQETCLLFFHELGHVRQFELSDPCFYDSNEHACENNAIKFASDNSFRCWGLK